MHGLGLKVKVNVDRVAKERLACLQTDARPAWLDDESGTDPSELRMRWRRGYCLSGERNLWSGEEGVISFGRRMGLGRSRLRKGGLYIRTEKGAAESRMHLDYLWW